MSIDVSRQTSFALPFPPNGPAHTYIIYIYLFSSVAEERESVFATVFAIDMIKTNTYHGQRGNTDIGSSPACIEIATNLLLSKMIGNKKDERKKDA